MGHGRKNVPSITGFAESLALGVSIAEGTPLRLSGQDHAKRAHSTSAMLVPGGYRIEAHLVPLANLSARANPTFCDNLKLLSLSKPVASAVEYGSAADIRKPWSCGKRSSASFVKVNGALSHHDQFISAGEDNGILLPRCRLLLPHGLKARARKHSSARIRTLPATGSEDNIKIAAVQRRAIFHMLRPGSPSGRQTLIVVTPKGACVLPRRR